MSEKETLRYLGIRSQQADEQTLSLIRECFRELEQVAKPKHTYRDYPLILTGSTIDISGLVTESEALGRNLKDCEAVLLFAATLGSQVDILLRKYIKLQMSKAVVMQAAATVMLEEYCDRENAKLKAAYQERGYYLRPRFSPGYGDFSLSCQREIASALELSKRIGITLTDSLLMVPSKSVTAVIGISSIPADCVVSGCEACSSETCSYRREW